MSLEKRINSDLKEAMKAKDKAAIRGIRAIKSAILLLKTDGSGQEITNEIEIKTLQKLIKQRKASLDIYESQNREDLAAIEREEISVIERYLPKQLEASAIEAILKDIIQQTGASSMRDMGKVMGIASKKLAGQADGKTISTIVRGLLS